MRICIVEDNGPLRGNLTLLLQGEPGLEVVGSHGAAEDALSHADWSRVDVLVADIDLPGISGVEMIQQVKQRNPAVNCLAYTIYEDRATVFAAIKAGACGYLLKGSSPRELVESIRAIHEGGSPMSPSIARKVLLDIQTASTPAPPGAVAGPLLSNRETSILKQIERGMSYKEIANALSISPHTVHTHIKKIYEKVHAHSRDEALRRARNLGFL